MIKNLNILFSNRDIFGFSKIKFWNKFFLWIFSSIIWLCFLSIFGAIQLEKIINPLKFSSSSSVLIEIHPENTSDKTQSKAEIVLDFLSTQKYISSYEKIDDNKIIDLIANFTGDKDSLQNINLPIIINVELKEYSDSVISDLRASLSQKVKGIYMDTETDLLKRLIAPIKLSTYISFFIPILALILLSCILFLMIYAILFSNKDFIRTLILLGIYKKTLYYEVAKWIFIRSMQSCLIVLILASATIALLHFSEIINIEVFQKNVYVVVFIFCVPLISVILGVLFVKRFISIYFNMK